LLEFMPGRMQTESLKNKMRQSTALSKALPDVPTHYSVRSLANLIWRRREVKERPYVLVLGSGASLSSGASSMEEIVSSIVQNHSIKNSDGKEPLEAFYDIIDQCSESERYNILEPHLRGATPSSGYRHLARLIRDRYFSLILTTNFDLFLEDAIMDAGMRASDFIKLLVGCNEPKQLVKTLKFNTPAVKILKLHGDLNWRIFAFTPAETAQFPESIEAAVADILSEDFIAFGISLRDRDVARCIRKEGGSIWYVNLEPSKSIDLAYEAIQARGKGKELSGEMARFDDFFGWLRLEILVTEALENTDDPTESQLLNAYRDSWSGEDLWKVAPLLEQMTKHYAEVQRIDFHELSLERCAAVYQNMGDYRRAAKNLRRLGKLHTDANLPAEAVLAYKQSLEFSRRAHHRKGEAVSLAQLGQCWRAIASPLRRVRKDQQAKEAMEKALDFWRECLSIFEELGATEQITRVKRWINEASEGESS